MKLFNPKRRKFLKLTAGTITGAVVASTFTPMLKALGSDASNTDEKPTELWLLEKAKNKLAPDLYNVASQEITKKTKRRKRRRKA